MSINCRSNPQDTAGVWNKRSRSASNNCNLPFGEICPQSNLLFPSMYGQLGVKHPTGSAKSTWLQSSELDMVYQYDLTRARFFGVETKSRGPMTRQTARTSQKSSRPSRPTERISFSWSLRCDMSVKFPALRSRDARYTFRPV